MSDRILFRSESLAEAEAELNRLMDALEDVAGDLSRLDTSEEWWSKLNVRSSHGSISAQGTVSALRSDLGRVRSYVAGVSSGIRKTRSQFAGADQAVSRSAEGMFVGTGYELNANGSGEVSQDAAMRGMVGQSLWERFREVFTDDFSWNEFLGGSGYIGKLYKFYQDVTKDGQSWTDYAKHLWKAYNFANEAYKTYKNYMKIGRAVGVKTATQWWLKNITGMKKLGRVSTAKKFSTRFVNNLKNKTSPFRKQLAETFGEYTGKAGAKKCFAAWAGVATTGALNYAANKAEQAASGGTMSDGRVIAETVVETAVDTLVDKGAGIVVGAAIAAVAPAAPAIVVVAASTVAVTAINAGVEAITGKTATEWVSDAIIDTGEAAVKAIGKGVQKAKKFFAGWGKKLAFA